MDKRLLKQLLDNLERILKETGATLRDVTASFAVQVGQIIAGLPRVRGRFDFEDPALADKFAAALSALDNLGDTAELQRLTDEIAAAFATQSDLIAAYYASLASDFGVVAFDAATVSLANALQQQAIKETIEGLSGSGFKQQLIKPAQDLLRANVSVGGTFQDFERQLKQQLGVYERYAHNTVTDSLNQFNAQTLQQFNQVAGLEFYRYSSGSQDTTRQFCRSRLGKYYHRKEVEAWAGLNWDGKRSGTTSNNIFTFRGGYNCRHQLIPVHVSAVPRDVVQRNIDSGNYKPKPNQNQDA